MEPDREGRVRDGAADKATNVWRTARRLHFSRDFRLNSQSLAACLTRMSTLGGRAWPGARRQVDAAGAGRRLTAVGTVVDRDQNAGVEGLYQSESPPRVGALAPFGCGATCRRAEDPGATGHRRARARAKGQLTPAAAAARRSRISADAASSMTKMAVMMITMSMATSTYLPSV